MKKFAAAATAAALSLTLATAPTADAASNTYPWLGANECRIFFYQDSIPRFIYMTPEQAQAKVKDDQPAVFAQTSSRLDQAFSSNDPNDELEAVIAVQACAEKKNYQTKPMTTGERAGIIISVIVAVLAAVAPAILAALPPHIRQMIPF